MTTFPLYGHEEFGQCFVNVHRIKFEMLTYGLKPVYGSLGFQDSHDGRVGWHYGGKNYTRHTQFEDFFGNIDGHAWFEDSDGNICDIAWDQYQRVPLFTPLIKTCPRKNPTWVLRSKIEWEKAGFFHHAAPDNLKPFFESISEQWANWDKVKAYVPPPRPPPRPRKEERAAKTKKKGMKGKKTTKKKRKKNSKKR